MVLLVRSGLQVLKRLVRWCVSGFKTWTENREAPLVKHPFCLSYIRLTNININIYSWKVVLLNFHKHFLIDNIHKFDIYTSYLLWEKFNSFVQALLCEQSPTLSDFVCWSNVTLVDPFKSAAVINTCQVLM